MISGARMNTFKNQELAKLFGYKLAKWKRWGREFLPPDPAAGLQCGVAREYTIHEVFTVFLGGYLVGTLKYSIPETRQILGDLVPWFGETGLYPWGESTDEKVWSINIQWAETGFFYEVKGLMNRRCISKFQ